MNARLHGCLRRFLPRRLRIRQGEAMAEAFDVALREARADGLRAVVRLWCRETYDLGRTGMMLRMARLRGKASASTPRGDRGLAAAGPALQRGARRRVWVSVGADVRAAARTLRRRPAFTVFAALTMALGLAAATSIFSAVEAVLINPLPFANGDRMVALFESSGSDRLLLSPGPESIERWRAQRDVLAGVEPVGSTTKRLTGQGAAATVQVALIRPQFHALTDRSPLLGRTFTEEEIRGAGAHVVILDHAFWRSRFDGSDEVLGSALELDGEPWTIVGVMPPRTVLPTFDTVAKQLWLPLSEERQRGATSVVGLLRTGVTVVGLTTRFDALYGQAQAEGASDARRGTALAIAEQRALFLRGSLRLLSLAVGMLMLIACLNVANLLLGSTDAQRDDMQVRVALGATGWNLVRQVLAQSLLLAAIGGLGGLVLTRLGLAALGALRPDNLRLLDTAAISAGTLIFALTVTVAAGFGAGMLPAVAVIRGQRGGGRSPRGRQVGPAGQRLRWGLIAAEVAFSFVLLVTCLLVAVDLYRLQHSDVGFEADRVAVVGVSLPPWKYDTTAARRAAWDDLEVRLRGLPGLLELTASSETPPSTGVAWGRVGIDDQPLSDEPYLLVGPAVRDDYFAILGQRIVTGRAFTAAEVRDGSDVIVLGEQAARSLLAGRDPLGARLRIGEDDEPRTVVGVAADVAMNGPAGVPELQMYRPLVDDYSPNFRTIVLRPEAGDDPHDLLAPARQVVVAEDPDILVTEVATADDRMIATLGRERFLAGLMATFAVLALVLAAVGLYGVIAGLVAQRTRELGIRMALGADARRIRRTVLRGGAIAVALGIVCGGPLVWATLRLVASTMVEELVGSPLVYVSAIVVLAVTALLATYVPTRRATRIDPIAAIRDA